MKILIQVDSKSWAIDQLAQKKIKYNPHHTFLCKYVHPRDAGQKHIQEDFEKTVKDFKPDVIHFEYFRSASQLLEALPTLRSYKIVLTHHNQRKSKALLHKDWNALGVDVIVTHTEKGKVILEEEGKQVNVKVIKHGIDLDYFEFNNEEPKEFTMGYVGRVVPWKNLKILAEACYELKVPLMFMGKMDKADYWASISEEVRNHINFSFMDCADDERLDFYKSISCLGTISNDDYEDGPLCYFEGMATGVPIITTPNGSARDIAKDRENCIVVPFGDKETLKEAIMEMKEDSELRKQFRKNGWETVKNYSDERMAYKYSKLYNNLGEHPLMSVIVPTYNRKMQVLEILQSIKEQSYPNIEVIIGDDGSDEERFLEDIIEWKEKNNLTVKIVRTNNDILREKGIKTYGLAEARNRAVCEAEGDYLVFIDSRIKPDPDAIMSFKLAIDDSTAVSESATKKVWYFGDKGPKKKSFVENFSAVNRELFIRFGMFNERINKYGGASQEIRTRWQSQGGKFFYLDSAKAGVISGSKKDTQRKKDIIKMKDLLFKLKM